MSNPSEGDGDPLNGLEVDNARVRQVLDALDHFTVKGKTYRLERDHFAGEAYIRRLDNE